MIAILPFRVIGNRSRSPKLCLLDDLMDFPEPELSFALTCKGNNQPAYPWLFLVFLKDVGHEVNVVN